MSESINVLLVEDSPVAMAMVSGMLAEADGVAFSVEFVETLTGGLKRLAVEGIDVVLLDLMLPDSHGLDTFERIHALSPELPVIILTCLDDPGMAIEAVREGAQDYLVKNYVDGSLLVRSIRYAIERNRANVEKVLRQNLQDVLEQAGAACHELNQPLQAISGYSELLLLQLDADDPSRMHIKTIVEQIMRMVDVTRKLNSITKCGPRGLRGDLRGRRRADLSSSPARLGMV